MHLSKSCAPYVILSLAFSAHLSISGFDFLTNQYVYFRYSEDAGLPYVPGQTLERISSYQSPSPPNSTRESVQSSTSRTLAILSFLSLGFSFFAALFVGHISDRYNRRFAIALVLLGQGLSNIVTVFVVLLHLPIFTLVVASLARGIVGGGLVALISQLNVYLADMTYTPTQLMDMNKSGLSVPDKRGQRERRRLLFLGACDASLFLASAIGYGLMGSVIEHCGFIVSVLGLLGVYCVPVFLIWFLPREQHEPRASVETVLFESSSQTVHAPNGPSLMQPVTQLTPSGLTGVLTVLKAHHPITTLVLVTLFLYFVVVLSESQYTFLYLMSEPFQWTPEQVGFYSGFGNFVMAISSLVLTLITVWLMRSKPSPSDVRSSSIVQSLSGSNVALLDANDPPDLDLHIPAGRVETISPCDLPNWLVLRSRRRMLIYTSCGLSLLTLSKLVMGSSFKLRPPWCHVAVLVALFISFARGAITSTLKSFLSSVHSPEGQGRLFSLVGVAEYCGMLVGLPGFAGLYGVTVSVCPGAVYFFSAGLILVTVALTLWLMWLIMRELSSIGQLANPLVLNVAQG